MSRLAWLQLRFRAGRALALLAGMRALALLAGMLVATTAFTVLITMAQWRQIQKIAGVQVAAPIAGCPPHSYSPRSEP